MGEKQIIFILGMGRTGSSALTRFISLCGAALPGRLLEGNDGNPRGHWEPLDALELNDKILADHGTNYFDPTMQLQREVIFDSEKEALYLRQIRAFLASCPDQPLLVIKEPRIAALAPLWFAAVR